MLKRLVESKQFKLTGMKSLASILYTLVLRFREQELFSWHRVLDVLGAKVTGSARSDTRPEIKGKRQSSGWLSLTGYFPLCC